MTDLDLRVAEESDTGRVRKYNEDYVRCIVPADEEQLRRKGALFLVADGMGGHQAGEEASKEAVARVAQEYYAGASDDVGDSLRRAIKAANKAVYEQANADPSLVGMGTTLVVAAIVGRELYVANVGDSRAYLLRRKRLEQITVDHSWVEEQVRAGLLTSRQAEQHPQRNLITRALGTRPQIEVDLFELDLREGDLLLLCTDGLSGQVSQGAITASLLSQPPPQAAVDLVEQANAQGGRDNVSLVIVQVGSRQRRGWVWARLAPLASWPPRQRLAVGLLALLLVCLCALVVAWPVANQRFAWKPTGAPQPAPIRFDMAEWADLERLAAHLNYDSLAEMEAAQPEALAASSTEADLWPADRGLFLVGLVRDWRCEGQVCTCRLQMADEVYQIELDSRSLSAEAPNLGGRRVRVFGQSPTAEGQVQVQVRLIDRGARWWAWWQPAWVTVYNAGHEDQPVWVYSVADDNPYSIIELEAYPALGRGEGILARGRWWTGGAEEAMGFVAESLYRLQGDVYVPLPEGRVVPPPTATLRPTNGP